MRRLWVLASLPLAVVIVASVAGANPLEAMRVLIMSSVGEPYALHSNTMVRWTPLVMTGLAVALAFHAAVWNVGAEGQFLAGALGALIGTQVFGPWAGLVVGTAAGLVWAGLAASWIALFDVSAVIVTLMLNFIAELMLSLAVHGPLQEPSGIYPQSAPLPPELWLSRVPGTRMHAGMLVAFGLVALTWWLLYRTVWGFRLRQVGANETAARWSGGVAVPRYRFVALALSGAIAGLAGAIELTGVTGTLYERFSPGYGYTAIAVAMAGGLHPAGVAAAAFLFAALEAGAAGLQREIGMPATLTLAIEGLALVLLLLAAGKTEEETPT